MSRPDRADPGQAPAVADMRAPIAIIGMACIFPQAPDLHAFWNNILEGVDAIGEPLEDRGARSATSRRADQDPVRRLPEGPVPLRSARVRDHAQLGGRRRNRPVPRLARRARRAGRRRLPGRGRGPFRNRHRARPQRLPARGPGHRHPEQHRPRPDHGPGARGDAAPGEDAARHARADAEEAAADQRRQRARPGPEHDDRAHRQPAQPARPQLRARRGLRLVAARGRRRRRRTAHRPQPDDARRRRQRDAARRRQRQLHPARRAQRARQGAPFEAGSDGTLLGEGLGVVVLKRLDDAIADGDRVRGAARVGHSSDGKGTGLLAPSHDGETLAIRRAYAGTGVDPGRSTWSRRTAPASRSATRPKSRRSARCSANAAPRSGPRRWAR